MATQVMFDDLNENHSMDKYDRVLMDSPDHPNDTQHETVAWQRFSDKPLGRNEKMKLPRDLLVIANEDGDVRGRLEELGYSSDDFVD